MKVLEPYKYHHPEVVGADYRTKTEEGRPLNKEDKIDGLDTIIFDHDIPKNAILGFKTKSTSKYLHIFIDRSKPTMKFDRHAYYGEVCATLKAVGY